MGSVLASPYFAGGASPGCLMGGGFSVLGGEAVASGIGVFGGFLSAAEFTGTFGHGWRIRLWRGLSRDSFAGK